MISKSTKTSNNANYPTNSQDSIPTLAARILAFGTIVLAGVCGGLIGFVVVDLDCKGECQIFAGFVGLASAIGTAVGTAIVAVLMLRSSVEWRLRNRHQNSNIF